MQIGKWSISERTIVSIAAGVWMMVLVNVIFAFFPIARSAFPPLFSKEEYMLMAIITHAFLYLAVVGKTSRTARLLSILIIETTIVETGIMLGMFVESFLKGG